MDSLLGMILDDILIFFFLGGGGLFKDTTVSDTLYAGGQLSVPYFEKGGSEKNKCLGGLKEFCHGYLPGGLTMFLVKNNTFKK